MYKLDIAHFDVGWMLGNRPVKPEYNKVRTIKYDVSQFLEDEHVSKKDFKYFSEHPQQTFNSFNDAVSRATYQKRVPLINIHYHILPLKLFSGRRRRQVLDYFKDKNIVGISSSVGYDSLKSKNKFRRITPTTIHKIADDLGVVFLQSAGNEGIKALFPSKNPSNLFYVGSGISYDTVPVVKNKSFSSIPYVFYPTAPDKILRKSDSSYGTSFAAPNLLGSLLGLSLVAAKSKKVKSLNAFVKASMLLTTQEYKNRHYGNLKIKDLPRYKNDIALKHLDNIMQNVVKQRNVKTTSLENSLIT